MAAEGSFFQLTCLEPPSLPKAKKWWLNPAGHTVRIVAKEMAAWLIFLLHL